MKHWIYLLATLTTGLFSCGEDKSSPAFRLEITAYNGSDTIFYCLSDSGLTLEFRDSPFISDIDPGTKFYLVSGQDSLKYVADLDVKSYSCKEQHALMALKVVFTNDSGTVQVDPYVNHPKELDIAVRIINSLVEEKYRLRYEDVQRAIEPIEKLNV